MKPDIITVWPVDTYYPLFVHQINKDRELFGRVIVVMTPGNNQDFDFTKDIEKNLDNVTVISPDILKLTAGGKDWRNVAVNDGYRFVNSKYVLHLEQDFLAGKDFYKELIEKGDGHDMVGIKEETRFHPCCLLVSDEITKKTDRDYSAYPPISDHFGRITGQIRNQTDGKVATLEELGLDDFFHMAGLTHNHRLNSDWHQVREFYTYLTCSCSLDIQPEDWREFSKKKCEQIKSMIGEIDINNYSYIKDLFEL